MELKDKEGKDVLKSANVTISWSAGALYNYLMHDGDLLNVVSGITMEEPMMTVREKKTGSGTCRNWLSTLLMNLQENFMVP